MILRISKRCIRLSLVIAVLATFGIEESQAQSGFISGYTVGGGLSLYGGDLDGQPEGAMLAYFAAGNVHLHAGVDKEIGNRFQVMLETQFNRFNGKNNIVEGSHNLVSFDLNGSVGLGPDKLFRLYAGVGPTMAFHSYNDLSTIAVVAGWAEESSSFGMTVPFGVIFSDRIRAGFRMSLTDAFDGRDGGASNDIFGIVAVSYRFSK